jgi:hypothetical protein
MGTNTIQIFQKAGLSKSGEYKYSEVANAFLSNGFTSTAGNTYFNSIRLIEGIIIKEDVGHGYARTFLNGIRIYSINDKAIISERSYHCKFYSPKIVLLEVQDMIFNILRQAAIKERIEFNSVEIKNHIQKITTRCFNSDQRELLQTIKNKSLIA